MHPVVDVADGRRSALPLAGRVVDQIVLDYGVRLEFLNDGPRVTLRLGVAFTVATSGADAVIDAEAPDTLGPIVDTLRRQVIEAIAWPDSSLTLVFEGGPTLTVQPHPEYEAWAIQADDGSMAICMPGGGLAIWGAAAKPDRQPIQ